MEMLNDIDPLYFFITLGVIIFYKVQSKEPEMTQLREINPQNREGRLF